VHATEHLQHAVVQRLHSDAEPGHAAVTQQAQALLVHRARVDLDGDLQLA